MATAMRQLKFKIIVWVGRYEIGKRTMDRIMYCDRLIGGTDFDGPSYCRLIFKIVLLRFCLRFHDLC